MLRTKMPLITKPQASRSEPGRPVARRAPDALSQGSPSAVWGVSLVHISIACQRNNAKFPRNVLNYTFFKCSVVVLRCRVLRLCLGMH